MPRRTKQKGKELYNAQTNKRTTLPTMVTKSYMCIIFLQSPERKQLNIIQKLIKWTLFIIKIFVVLFLPYYPRTTEPNWMHNRMSRFKNACQVAKLNKMIHNSKRINWRKPSQLQTRCQRELKRLQAKNKWFANSRFPQPLTQSRAFERMMSRLNKLSLVGNLFRRSRQANKDTFNGTSLCQIRSNTTEKWRAS